jgi:hypothetical protein
MRETGAAAAAGAGGETLAYRVSVPDDKHTALLECNFTQRPDGRPQAPAAVCTHRHFPECAPKSPFAWRQRTFLRHSTARTIIIM